MANNNDQNITNNEDGQINQIQVPQTNQQKTFEQTKKKAVDANGGDDGTNHHHADLPGIKGLDLVNISIRQIDKNIDGSINQGSLKIDSFDEYKRNNENKYKGLDEEVIKHLYFNDVLTNVFSNFTHNGRNAIYFKTQQDYQILVDYLQAKTLQLINDKNGNDLGQSSGNPQFGKYINLQLKDIDEGNVNNNYCSNATIVNNSSILQQYGDNIVKTERPFVSTVSCSFNASDGFYYHGTCINKGHKEDIHKLGKDYEKQDSKKKWLIALLIILAILCAALAIAAGILGYLYTKKKKEEEEEKQKEEEEKKAEALDDHTNVKSTKDASIKYAQGTNVARTGKDSKGNKVSVVTDVNDVKYGKDMEVNGQLKDATELVAAGEVKNITANGKNYNVLNIDVTKGVDGGADKYRLTLADGTTKTFNQDQISSVKIGNKEYVGCLDTMENVDVQRSGNNTYFYYNTNDLEANLTTNNPTVTAYDANGAAMISTNATSEAGLSMLQQIYDDNPGVQYNARLNTLLGQDWYDKNGHLHDYKTGNLVDNYEDKKLEVTDNINSDISSYYSGLEQRNSADHTNYGATEKYNDFTKNYGSNYTNKIENSGFSLYDNITTNNSVNTAASYNLNSTYKDRTNCLFA